MALIVGSIAFCVVLLVFPSQNQRVGVDIMNGVPHFKSYHAKNSSTVTIDRFTAQPVWNTSGSHGNKTQLRFYFSVKTDQKTYYLAQSPSGMLTFVNNSLDAAMFEADNFRTNASPYSAGINMNRKFFLTFHSDEGKQSILHILTGGEEEKMQLLEKGSRPPRGHKIVLGRAVTH